MSRRGERVGAAVGLAGSGPCSEPDSGRGGSRAYGSGTGDRGVTLVRAYWCL